MKLLIALTAFLFLGAATSFAQTTTQSQLTILGTQAKYYASQGPALVAAGTMTKQDVYLRKDLYTAIHGMVKKGSTLDNAIEKALFSMYSEGGGAQPNIPPVSPGVQLNKVQIQALTNEINALF